MSNAVAKTGGNAVDSGFNPWAEEGKDSGGFIGQFAKFNGKTGEYTYGQDAEEIEPGTQIIVDFALITKGYNCWVEEAVVDRVSVTIESGEKINVKDLTDHGPYEKHEDGTGDGWQEVHALPFVIDDEDDDNAYLLQLSSGGGIRAMRKLYKSYGKAFMSKIDDDGNYMLPLIELDVDSYKSKKKRVGTIYNPVFEIVDWLTRAEVATRIALLDGAADNAGGSSDDEDNSEEVENEAPKGRKATKEKEDTAPKGRKGKTKEVEKEDEKEDEAPKRGRRQKKDNDEDTGGIEPEDHGEDDGADDSTTEDEAPKRGRRSRKAATEDDAPADDEDKGTRRASGRRARRF